MAQKKTKATATRKKKGAAKKKAPAKKKVAAKKEAPAKKRAAAPPVPPDQEPFAQYKNPRQPPREESVKPQRPTPGRFHPGRGDIGGRG